MLDSASPPVSVLCHEWVTTYGGSEQVAAELAHVIDASGIYTFTAREQFANELFAGRPVHSTRLGQRRVAKNNWQWLLPTMPSAWREFDTRYADLVVSSSHSCVNSIRAHPHQVRVSYCHSPMRYAWYWREELGRLPRPLRPMWPALARRFRVHDKLWSTNVDVYVANSKFTRQRILEAYGQVAEVVYPPIDIEFWHPDPTIAREDFLLVAGRLVAYKRPDLVVQAANRTGRRVVIAGSGPMLEDLQAIAGPSVDFVIQPSRLELRDLYRRASGIVYPQVEEFGMTLVEAASCGTPALALAAGGARETVIDGTTGMLYRDDDVLADAVARFDGSAYDERDILSHARQFRREAFQQQMRDIIAEAVATRSHRRDRDEWAADLSNAAQ